MQHGWDWQAMSTVVADSSTAEEGTARARQLVIVNSGYNGNPRITASIEDSCAEQRKRVVDVDHLRAVLVQHCPQITVGFAAPDRPHRERRLLRHRPLLDLVAAPPKPHDLVAQGRERFALLVDDTV